jgi:hypothetical protein
VGCPLCSCLCVKMRHAYGLLFLVSVSSVLEMRLDINKVLVR